MGIHAIAKFKSLDSNKFILEKYSQTALFSKEESNQNLAISKEL